LAQEKVVPDQLVEDTGLSPLWWRQVGFFDTKLDVQLVLVAGADKSTGAGRRLGERLQRRRRYGNRGVEQGADLYPRRRQWPDALHHGGKKFKSFEDLRSQSRPSGLTSGTAFVLRRVLREGAGVSARL
jgi:hypothetical protein